MVQHDKRLPRALALTDTGKTVLTYLLTELTFREIADELGLSRHVVKSHVVTIYRQLGVSSRQDAVRAAEELRRRQAFFTATGDGSKPHAPSLNHARRPDRTAGCGR